MYYNIILVEVDIMLLQFNVSNFMSFKEETILNLSAGSLIGHENYILKNEKGNALPSIAVFGANASGKSNLFKALTSSILIIRNSARLQVNDSIPWIIPFAFDHESLLKPSSFNYIFIYNEIKYEYGFSANSKEIINEYLYAYNSQKPSLIFEREKNSYKFVESSKKELEKFAALTNPNKLFLSNATSLNCSITKPAFMWFAEYIDTYDSKDLEQMLNSSLDYNFDPNLPFFMENLLREADINISGYSFEIEEVSQDFKTSFAKQMGIDENRMNNLKASKITTHHKIIKNGVEESFDLDLANESKGTIKLFSYGPIIKKSLEKGKTIFIDEIDNCLHPMLVKYLIGLFNDLSINKNGAQLIFNTHDTNLLNLNLFRRDQIYFVEKDFNSGKSELYSLDEFSVRNTDKVDRDYLVGRFGAIPNI